MSNQEIKKDENSSKVNSNSWEQMKESRKNEQKETCSKKNTNSYENVQDKKNEEKGWAFILIYLLALAVITGSVRSVGQRSEEKRRQRIEKEHYIKFRYMYEE